MPLYEFECQDCHHEFEELVSASSTESPSCPVCGEKHTRKKVSAGAIRASGFSGGSASSIGSSCSTSGG